MVAALRNGRHRVGAMASSVDRTEATRAAVQCTHFGYLSLFFSTARVECLGVLTLSHLVYVVPALACSGIALWINCVDNRAPRRNGERDDV